MLSVLGWKIEDWELQVNPKNPTQKFTPPLPDLSTSEVSQTMERLTLVPYWIDRVAGDDLSYGQGVSKRVYKPKRAGIGCPGRGVRYPTPRESSGTKFLNHRR